MSRGLGRVQRQILDELAALPPGSAVLVGDGGWSYRRAARGLAERGLVILEERRLYGRRRVLARLKAEGAAR